MFKLKISFALLILATAISLAFVSLNDMNVVQEPDSGARVQLRLSNVSVEKRSNEILLRCNVILKINTHQKIIVKSHYYSAFDELGLVVMDGKGKTISEQERSRLLSPYSFEPRSFELQEGVNNGELRFVVIGLPDGLLRYKVQLKSAFALEDTGAPLVSNIADVISR